jgi:hypothetical protein
MKILLATSYTAARADRPASAGRRRPNAEAADWRQFSLEIRRFWIGAWCRGTNERIQTKTPQPKARR